MGQKCVSNKNAIEKHTFAKREKKDISVHMKASQKFLLDEDTGDASANTYKLKLDKGVDDLEDTFVDLGDYLDDLPGRTKA